MKLVPYDGIAPNQKTVLVVEHDGKSFLVLKYASKLLSLPNRKLMWQRIKNYMRDEGFYQLLVDADPTHRMSSCYSPRVLVFSVCDLRCIYNDSKLFKRLVAAIDRRHKDDPDWPEKLAFARMRHLGGVKKAHRDNSFGQSCNILPAVAPTMSTRKRPLQLPPAPAAVVKQEVEDNVIWCGSVSALQE